jgi:hypothetical protein
VCSFYVIEIYADPSIIFTNKNMNSILSEKVKNRGSIVLETRGKFHDKFYTVPKTIGQDIEQKQNYIKKKKVALVLRYQIQ